MHAEAGRYAAPMVETRRIARSAAPLAMAVLLAACVPQQPAAPAPGAPPAPAAEAALALPPQLVGKAVVVADGDPDAARADLPGAVKPPGQGALTRGLVVRLVADVPVWRLWSGPAKKDANGRTNRMGQWWAYDAPRGTQQGYRSAYEVCDAWNDLTFVARCTLKKGAVVAIGPGNSVAPATCGDATGKESYAENPRDWQVWISKVWTRGAEIECPDEATDYEADPADISRPRRQGR
jgi:hypothetical protein